MKVLMMVTYLDVGGTETHVLSLARALQKIGYTLGVISKGGPMVGKFRLSGIRVHLIPRNAHGAQVARIIGKIIHDERYQVVHAHDTDSFAVIGKYPSLLRVPSVLTIHGKYYSVPALQRALTAANRVIAVSPSIYQWVQRMGIDKKKLTLIPNGIDTNLFSPQQNRRRIREPFRTVPDAFIVAYVSRFHGAKVRVARKVILASERVAHRHPNFRVVMQGVGTSRTQLMREASRVNHSLERKVISFVPTTQPVQRTYNTADLVVGTGRVAMEAMATGKPVIAVGVAGYHGIVTPKSVQNAIQTNFGDHSASRITTPMILARDIQVLVQQPQFARKLSHFGRKIIVASFSIRVISRRISRVYSMACNNMGPV